MLVDPGLFEHERFPLRRHPLNCIFFINLLWQKMWSLMNMNINISLLDKQTTLIAWLLSYKNSIKCLRNLMFLSNHRINKKLAFAEQIFDFGRNFYLKFICIKMKYRHYEYRHYGGKIFSLSVLLCDNCILFVCISSCKHCVLFKFNNINAWILNRMSRSEQKSISQVLLLLKNCRTTT